MRILRPVRCGCGCDDVVDDVDDVDVEDVVESEEAEEFDGGTGRSSILARSLAILTSLDGFTEASDTQVMI